MGHLFHCQPDYAGAHENLTVCALQQGRPKGGGKVKIIVSPTKVRDPMPLPVVLSGEYNNIGNNHLFATREL